MAENRILSANGQHISTSKEEVPITIYDLDAPVDLRKAMLWRRFHDTKPYWVGAGITEAMAMHDDPATRERLIKEQRTLMKNKTSEILARYLLVIKDFHGIKEVWITAQDKSEIGSKNITYDCKLWFK